MQVRAQRVQSEAASKENYKHIQALWQIPGLPWARKRHFFNRPLWTWIYKGQCWSPGFHCSVRKGKLDGGESTPVTPHFSFILLICSSRASRGLSRPLCQDSMHILQNQQEHIHCIQLEPPTTRPTVWESIIFLRELEYCLGNYKIKSWEAQP